MRTAFLFAGQGVDLGMIGPPLAADLPAVARLLAVAADELETPIDAFWARGARLLESTAVYQPVLTAVTLGITCALQERGVHADLLAGHSLGELAAWSAAGAFTAEQAVHIAAVRGRLMADCAAGRPGGMLALIDLTEAGAADVLARHNGPGQLYLVAANAPDEWVFAGADAALRELAASFRSVRLPIRGPWHSPLMQPAAVRFREFMDTIPARPFHTRLVTNLTGEQVNDPSRMSELLADQLVRPVRWADTLRTIVRLDASDLVLIGPGKVLRGLAHRNQFEGRIHATETPEQVACIAAWLAS